jgi:5-methylcytosine-specific restriction endonuclease McrA
VPRFYDKAIWRALRKRIVARDGYRCVICHARVDGVGAARVDHIIGLKRAPHRALDPTNLRTLCAECDNQRRERVALGGERIGQGKGCDERGFPLAPSHPWLQV